MTPVENLDQLEGQEAIVLNLFGQHIAQADKEINKKIKSDVGKDSPVKLI